MGKRLSKEELVSKIMQALFYDKWIPTTELVNRVGCSSFDLSSYRSPYRKALLSLLIDGVVLKTGTKRFLYKLSSGNDNDKKVNRDGDDELKMKIKDSMYTDHWVGTRELSKTTGIPYNYFTTRGTAVFAALKSMKRNGEIIIEQNMPGSPVRFKLIEKPTPTTRIEPESPGNDEEKLLLALRDYVQAKKNESLVEYSNMEKEIERLTKERDYFSKLAKEYKETIDRLETELANKEFKLW